MHQQREVGQVEETTFAMAETSFLTDQTIFPRVAKAEGRQMQFSEPTPAAKRFQAELWSHRIIIPAPKQTGL